MILIKSPPVREMRRPARTPRKGDSQEDGNDVRQIEGYRSQRKNCISRDRASKIQKARKDREEGGEPDCADGGSGVIVHHCEVTAVWETFITTEGVNGSRTSLEGSLYDKESGEADESPEEEGSGFPDPHSHDLIPVSTIFGESLVGGTT